MITRTEYVGGRVSSFHAMDLNGDRLTAPTELDMDVEAFRVEYSSSSSAYGASPLQRKRAVPHLSRSQFSAVINSRTILWVAHARRPAVQ